MGLPDLDRNTTCGRSNEAIFNGYYFERQIVFIGCRKVLEEWRDTNVEWRILDEEVRIRLNRAKRKRITNTRITINRYTDNDYTNNPAKAHKPKPWRTFLLLICSLFCSIWAEWWVLVFIFPKKSPWKQWQCRAIYDGFGANTRLGHRHVHLRYFSQQQYVFGRTGKSLWQQLELLRIQSFHALGSVGSY